MKFGYDVALKEGALAYAGGARHDHLLLLHVGCSQPFPAHLC